MEDMNRSIHEILGNTDIYLVDQIMKGRYKQGELVLDAGCGGGRNLYWFVQNGFSVYGVDADAAAIDNMKQVYTAITPDHFRVETVESLSFQSNYFDHVISSAVLHFANDPDHFFAMMREMLRVLKPGGSLFIRMASDIGLEKKVVPAGHGVYYLPDGSTRFLLTRKLLQKVAKDFAVVLLEPFKTVNVSDLRCMSTLVLARES
jgi:2-polyprenyl-3-methyl-5-hydroxy-6-metoxy-1,4-benzoquinol methylase